MANKNQGDFLQMNLRKTPSPIGKHPCFIRSGCKYRLYTD